jgi:hypothetical protein
MSDVLRLNADRTVVRSAHELRAQAEREARAQFFDSDENKRSDWYRAQHMLGRSIAADSIQEINRKDLHSVILVDDYVPYLSDVSIDSCRELMSWRIWKMGGGKVDADANRIARDRLEAENEIRQAVFRLTPSKITESVVDYLKRTYLDARDSVIARKAFWHYLAYPESGWAANNIAAKNYVDEFYYLAFAVATHITTRPVDGLRRLVLGSSCIADCVELFFVGLQRIERSVEAAEPTGSKESAASPSGMTPIS